MPVTCGSWFLVFMLMMRKRPKLSNSLARRGLTMRPLIRARMMDKILSPMKVTAEE